MMKTFKLIVAENDPKKLGHFLFKHGFSKRAVKNAQHHQGMIFVNHKRRLTSFGLKAGDEVLFVMGQEKENKWLKPSQQPIAIVQETPDWLLINKPAGLLSIPSRYEDDDALVNRLLGYFVKQNVAPVQAKPHVITRLDRMTSGLVLVAKNAVTAAQLNALDKNVFVKKYHAIVHGNFAAGKLKGQIDLPIAKTSSSVKRSVVSNGQRAITNYRVLDQVPGASYLEIRLLTGRTHQIRVHFAHLGHPLYGDQLYGLADGFGRQALNCFYLAFPGCQKQIVDPGDMQLLWQRLKKAAADKK